MILLFFLSIQLFFKNFWNLLVVLKDDAVAMSDDVSSGVVQLFLVVVHQVSVEFHFFLDTAHLNAVLVDGLSNLTFVFFQSLLDFFDHTEMGIHFIITKIIVGVEGK